MSRAREVQLWGGPLDGVRCLAPPGVTRLRFPVPLGRPGLAWREEDGHPCVEYAVAVYEARPDSRFARFVS